MYRENKKRVTVWRFVFAAVTALVLCAVCVGSVSAWSADTTWGSDYNSASVFYIADAGDLAQFASLVNDGKDFSGKTVILQNDIDLNNQSWTPIGTAAEPFMGTFDGGNHVVENVYEEYDSKSFDCIGLFGCVAAPGKVQNLLLGYSKFDIKHDASIGSLVGWLKGGVVENCSVIGETVVVVGTQGQNKYDIGGLIGKATTSTGNPIDASALSDYLQGSCTVQVFDTTYNKDSGWIVGQPDVDESSGSDEPTPQTPVYAYYNVSTYVMDVNGNYGSPQKTMYAGLSGSSASAIYSVTEGFSLDPQSKVSGVITADNSLVLSVYLQRNYTTITLMSDGNVYATTSGYYGNTLVVLFNPQKSGYTFAG